MASPEPTPEAPRHELVGDLGWLEYAIADYIAKWGENWTGRPYLGEYGPNIPGMPTAMANMAMTVIRKNLGDPTQPVPGPTREQIAQLIAKSYRSPMSTNEWINAAAEAIVALLPARPSPTDDDLSRLISNLRVLAAGIANGGTFGDEWPKLLREGADLLFAVLDERAEIERLRAHQGTT